MVTGKESWKKYWKRTCTSVQYKKMRQKKANGFINNYLQWKSSKRKMKKKNKEKKNTLIWNKNKNKTFGLDKKRQNLHFMVYRKRFTFSFIYIFLAVCTLNRLKMSYDPSIFIVNSNRPRELYYISLEWIKRWKIKIITFVRGNCPKQILIYIRRHMYYQKYFDSVYICIPIFIYIYKYTYLCISLSLSLYIYIYIYIYICVCVCVFVYIYIYAHTHIHTHTHTHTHIYIYIYIYI